MIVPIPPRLLANLRAQQAALNQTIAGWLLTLDLPEGTIANLDLPNGVVVIPEPDDAAQNLLDSLNAS